MKIDVEQATRLSTFDENELHLIRGALVSFADDILNDAVGEEINADDLGPAGATYAQAMALAYEVDDQLGHAHPSIDSAVTLGAVIAEGDAPLVQKMFAETQEQA